MMPFSLTFSRQSLAVCVLFFSAVAVNAKPVTVSIKDGPVVGVADDLANSFRGIPFAQPPVGNLRWKSPLPASAWGPQPINATQDKPGCYQRCTLPPHTCPPSVSEDCLYVNVFTPLNATMSSNLPVMFFIYGGDYKQGYNGGLLYDGRQFAHNENVVVVIPNYRVGAFGFLRTQENIKGNFGIQDQRLAMTWARDNIQAFGGDPNNVMIFGQSAGAVSVAVHLVSPDSRGLFNAAIMESEPLGLPLRTDDTWKSFAEAFMKDAGCPTTNSDACLMSKSADDILAAAVKAEHDILAQIGDILDLFLAWSPTSGTSEIPLAPFQAFRIGEVAPVPYVIGTVRNEGVMFVHEGFGKSMSGLEYDALLAVFFGLEHVGAIKKQYPNPGGDARPALAAVATDALFVCPGRNASLDGPVSKGTPVYTYMFDHVFSFSKAAWGPNYTFCDDVVCHGEELDFVFDAQAKEYGFIFTPAEASLASSMQRYWSSMARSHAPGSFDSLTWPQFESGSEHLMEFATPSNTVLDAPTREKCALWDSIGYHYSV